MIKKYLQTTRPLCVISSAERRKYLDDPKSPYFKMSQYAERVAVRFNIFSRLYFNIIYKKMLSKEVALANLKTGASILHIGGGAYPFTAIFLAQEGYRIHACDCDNTAVEVSKNIVAKSNMSHQISIFCKSGCIVNCSDYDAVWVSLNICPKKRVLEQSWASLKKGGILVYRKLPSWLSLLGIRDVLFNGDNGNRVKKARSVLIAESLVIEKNNSFTEDIDFFSATS